MSSIARKLKRQKEKEELKNIHKTYGKKPKGVCPKCKKHSLFFTNKDNETLCIRRKNVVALNRVN